jgi:hypothetical protein
VDEPCKTIYVDTIFVGGRWKIVYVDTIFVDDRLEDCMYRHYFRE